MAETIDAFSEQALKRVLFAVDGVREVLARASETIAAQADQYNLLKEDAEALAAFVQERIQACGCTTGDCHVCLRAVAALAAYRQRTK